MEKWAEEAIAAHSIFEEAGIELELRWNDEKGRVEAVCHDIPSYIFPINSWYVSKKLWDSGEVVPCLHKQLGYLQEYFNGH